MYVKVIYRKECLESKLKIDYYNKIIVLRNYVFCLNGTI